jgi:hypothetical protein
MSVAHDEQGWILEACLNWQIMISISQGNMFHVILVFGLCLQSNILGDMSFELLQQGLIVLQVTCLRMKAQDTHEDISVVGQVGQT